MRPVDGAKTVNYEKLYAATVGGDTLCQVRAKTAQHAEAKLMECFLKDLPGKTIDYDLEAYLKSKNKEGEPCPAEA